MGSALAGEAWQVECASGWTYAERPLALRRGGQRLEIERIERMWRGPDGRHFTVNIQNDRSAHLFYNEAEDHWSVELI